MDKGSVFKTWRQDDHHLQKLSELLDKQKISTIANDESQSEIKDKLKTFFDTSSAILPNISDFINYTHCWPKDWLGADFNNKCNIYGVNYNSILTYWDSVSDKKSGSNNTIKMRSNDLRKQLEMANIGKKPIVWIVHSMGGLILKQLLLNMSNSSDRSSILDNTKGILFFSTPHLGSTFAKRALHLSYALLPSQEIEDLALDNKYLKLLNEDFIELAKGKNWKIVSFCEKFSSHVGYNLWVKLVPEHSAQLPSELSEFTVLETDHFYICKPDTRESIIYRSAVNLINIVYAEYMKKMTKDIELKKDKRTYWSY